MSGRLVFRFSAFHTADIDRHAARLGVNSAEVLRRMFMLFRHAMDADHIELITHDSDGRPQVQTVLIKE